MTFWQASTFILLGGLVYATLLGREQERERERIVKHYMDEVRSQVAIANWRCAVENPR